MNVRAIWNLGVSPDDRLNHVSLRLGIQFRDVRERGVIHVVLASPLVVTIVVTLLAIADRMVPVVARALGRETDADRRFVRRFAILASFQEIKFMRINHLRSRISWIELLYFNIFTYLCVIKKENLLNIEVVSRDILINRVIMMCILDFYIGRASIEIKCRSMCFSYFIES